MSSSKNISIFDAKTRFSEVVNDVSKGSSYIVTNRGVPVAVIYPYRDETKFSIEEKLEELIKTSHATPAVRPWKESFEVVKSIPKAEGRVDEFIKDRD